MVKLEDQMNNKNLETLQKIFEVCSLVHFCEKDQYFALHFFPLTPGPKVWLQVENVKCKSSVW